MMMLLPLAAMLAVPVELHPAGPWQVSEQQLGCQVTRSFTGDADVEFGFETYLTGSNITMLLAAPKTMLPAKGPSEIRVGVSPTVSLDLHFGLFELPDQKLRLIKVFPDKTALEAIAGAETLTFGAAPIRVPVKGAGGVLSALRTCTEGLLTKWGVNPQRWRDGKLAGFGGRPQSWLTNDDADKILPRGVSSGAITAVVTTTPDGAPATCKIVVTTDPRVNAPFCALLMKRVKFRAPLGDDGKPMESYAVVPFQMTR